MVAPAGIEPATHGASVRCSTNWATEPWRSRRELNPRSSPWQGDVLNHFTTGPYGCGDWTWTNDLRVMSPTSCQTAPLRDIYLILFLFDALYKRANGGWWGIRTPAGREAPDSFQDYSLQPGLGNHPWWT